MKRALAQALVLSAVLQLVVLAAPFYMQLAVDEAVMKGDRGLLTALALGFGLLTLIHIGADWLRSHVLLFLSGALNFQMGANLFHHLVRLPLNWFEKRHIGDLVSRFRSAEPIQRLISEGLVAAFVDGVMATLTLAMILIYSPKLSGIVFAALALYALLRFALYRSLRQRQEEMIEAAAKEQTTFIETARAIQSIKIFGRESDREAVWQNRYAESISRSIRQGRFTIGFKTANDLIYGLENVLVVCLGARAIMANELTIGMLYAFMAYKEQFLGKATNLIETGIQYRMLDLHLDRLSDIALTEREEDRHAESLVARPIRGAVELQAVSFRYADTEPEVLSGVDLKVEAGEFVAITGPSGGGKTTLLKLMLGLFKPMEGAVLIDGTPLEHFGRQAFRSQIGVVMQDDQLLSGSIAENICFFDAQPRPRLDARMRQGGRHRRRDHGDADELQHADRRHGHRPLGRPAPAGAARPRALPPPAHAVHGRGHLASRPRQGARGQPGAGGAEDHPHRHRPPPGDDPGCGPDRGAARGPGLTASRRRDAGLRRCGAQLARGYEHRPVVT